VLPSPIGGIGRLRGPPGAGGSLGFFDGAAAWPPGAVPAMWAAATFRRAREAAA
jgi:hypothetical protein